MYKTPTVTPLDNNCKCCAECLDLPNLTYHIFYHSQYQYKYPCFNPNNSNEIVFFFRDYKNNLKQLIKYNILSKEKTILLNNIILISQPKWSKDNWILLNNLYHEIIKIKSNGDSLTTVASGNYNLYPDCNDNNKRIIYTYSLNAAAPYCIISKNYKTNYSDTISNISAFHLSISNTDKLVTTTNYNMDLIIANLSNNLEWSNLTNVEEHGNKSIEGITWHPNSEDIYYTRILKGIYKLNINSLDELHIKNSCDTRKYSAISVSSNGVKIIVERINSYINDENKLYNDSRLYIMDIDGCNEQEIIIQ